MKWFVCWLLLCQLPPNHYVTHIISIHDGDTFRANVDLGFDVTLRSESCRLANFDAWEINRTRRSVNVTDAEIVKGKAAREALVKMVYNGTSITIESVPPVRDKYGRLLVNLIIDGKDVATELRKQGFERH